MGIIKATATALRSAAADQWKEAFCAGEMGSDLLMIRAKKIAGQSGSNAGSGSVITDGSVIIVGEGECAVATEGGKIIGIYDQPGENIFSSKQSSGIFGGGLSAFIKDVGNRISFGGDRAISQRIYYINTKELTGGTIRAENVPLRYKDPVTGFDMDGSYTFRISRPELFFNAAIRSVDGRSRRDLLKQMDSEVLTALGSVLAEMTADGVRPSNFMQHTQSLCEKLRQVMSDKWSGLRGIEVFSVALESVTVADLATVTMLQRDAVFQNPIMAAAHLNGAAADAMEAAAANASGAAVMAAAVLDDPSSQNRRWRCSCGAENNGKFCTECGAKKPAYNKKIQKD